MSLSHGICNSFFLEAGADYNFLFTSAHGMLHNYKEIYMRHGFDNYLEEQIAIYEQKKAMR